VQSASPLSSSDACPIDPEELANAFALITRVFSGEDDFDPSGYSMNVLNEHGELQQVPVEDSILNRIMLALRDWCHEESPEKFASLCWRLFALNELIHQGSLSEWVAVDGQTGFLTIPGIIIRVAATLPLKNGQGFDPHIFLQAVRRLLA
jgi:hypothetical protein